MDRRRFLALAGAGIAGAALVGTPARDALAADNTDYPGAVWRPAHPSNYRESNRERSYNIDRLVIHLAQSSYEDTIESFQKPDNWRSASHYVVGSSGRVAQMVRHRDIPWQSSNRSWDRRSIGIEHEGVGDDPSIWTDAMMEASARLAAYCCRRHRIPVDRRHIVGHNEVPGSYYDCPGQYFPWTRYLQLVRRYK